MKFAAAGDAIIQRRIYADYEGYGELAPFIGQGDARFFNLETTLNREGEACGSQFSGGTYLRVDPEVLDDLKKFDFNMTSFNNNHALDFFYTGFEKTLEAVEQSGLVHAGCGRNLGQAAAPAYLETKNGRVALISVNTTFWPSLMAGEQNSRVSGRPGINGLRVSQQVMLEKEDFEAIKRIAHKSKINVEIEIERGEGYYAELESNECEMGELQFVLGDHAECIMTVDPRDIERVKRAIYEAKLQADYILVSVHSHELSGDAKENPAKFLVDFAHFCIDNGANAIIGHGPHLLRPVEVYKDCPIFYSLGDFALQLYSIEFAPEEFFENNGLTSSSTIHELLAKRSKNFTRGLMTDPRMFRAVIPLWETEGTRLTKLTFMPIEMPMDSHKSANGLPRRSYNKEIFDYFAAMSAPYGVTMEWTEEGLIECRW